MKGLLKVMVSTRFLSIEVNVEISVSSTSLIHTSRAPLNPLTVALTGLLDLVSMAIQALTNANSSPVVLEKEAVLSSEVNPTFGRE